MAATLVVWSVQAIRHRRLWPRRIRIKPWQGATGLTLLLGYWGVRLTLHYRLGMVAFPLP